jgi:beta-galactosidase
MKNGRVVTALDGKWNFCTDPDRIGEVQGWERNGLPAPVPVTVPHTWNVAEGLEDYRGLAWYEYPFAAPQEWAGQKVRIEFEAVYRDADIWLNGSRIGRHHQSGYTLFHVDATSAIRLGEVNRLTVAVDSSFREDALPSGASFDWAADGGIIRGVSFICTGNPAVDYVKVHASPRFEGMKPAGGRIGIDVLLCDDLPDTNDPVQFEFTIVKLGQGGSPDEAVWSGSECRSLNGTKQTLSAIRLDQVALWHFDHPNLYLLKLKIVKEDMVTDEVEVRFGFREFIAAGSSFLLNREPVRLMGVEWMPGSNPEFGMAESESYIETILCQLKEANCIFTRFHWQQSRHLLDWCDRNGILIQEEIPHWQLPHDPGDTVMEMAKRQADEMISRHYNHPCIFAWGMGNEVNGGSAATISHFERLKAYIYTQDESRLINYVSHTIHDSKGRDATAGGDTLMWNDYVGTWHGNHDVDKVIQGIIAKYPHHPLVVSEYGLCEPAYDGGDERRIQILREKTEKYREYPEIAGAYFFSLNDYRTHQGEAGAGKGQQRVHGVTDLSGSLKGSYQKLKEFSSPVFIKSANVRPGGRVEVCLEVRNDLPSYTISGYEIVISAQESDGQSHRAVKPIPDSIPGTVLELVFEGLPNEPEWIKAEVFRPTGFRVLAEDIIL